VLTIFFSNENDTQKNSHASAGFHLGITLSQLLFLFQEKDHFTKTKIEQVALVIASGFQNGLVYKTTITK